MMNDNYADVPPGCQYFNPRRQRRHDRKTREMFALTSARRIEAELKAERAAAVRERVKQEKQGDGFVAALKTKAKGFTQTLFGRKTG